MSGLKLSLIVLGKELREAFRDRRTVLLTLVIPLLFYPLLVGAFGFFAGRTLLENQTRTLKVAVVADDRAESLATSLNALVQGSGGILFDAMGEEERSEAPGSDVTILATPGSGELDWEIVCRYKSTAEGKVARQRVEEVLARWGEEMTTARLTELELTRGDITPVQIEWQDTATAVVALGREATGMLIYFLLFLSFTACLSVAVDVGAGEKERGTMETLLTTPAHRGAIFTGKLAAVMIVGCASTLCAVLGFGSVMGLGMTADPAMQKLAGDLLHWERLVVALPLLVLAVLLLASITLAVSVHANGAKQAQALLAPLLMVVALALVIVTTPGVALNGTTAWIPVLNAALSVRALLTAEPHALWMVVLAVSITLLLIASTIWMGSRALKSERALGRS